MAALVRTNDRHTDRCKAGKIRDAEEGDEKAIINTILTGVGMKNKRTLEDAGRWREENGRHKQT